MCFHESSSDYVAIRAWDFTIAFRCPVIHRTYQFAKKLRADGQHGLHERELVKASLEDGSGHDVDRLNAFARVQPYCQCQVSGPIAKEAS